MIPANGYAPLSTHPGIPMGISAWALCVPHHLFEGVYVAMTTRIYVGNLPYNVTNEDLAQLFAPYGEVGDAVVVMDRDTGRSKGFGFVEMPEEAARAAIAGLNGTQLGERTITVNEARPREDRSRSRW